MTYDEVHDAVERIARMLLSVLVVASLVTAGQVAW
jgi:hypothetical protein